jgi:hypothetical protein
MPPEKWETIDYYSSYILVSSGMIFRNKNKFWYGIPAYIGPFRALVISYQPYDSRESLFCPYGLETARTVHILMVSSISSYFHIEL